MKNSKFFATVYSTSGRNTKEKELNIWLDTHVHQMLIGDMDSLDELWKIVQAKATELDQKYPRSKKLQPSYNRTGGFPYHIHASECAYITIVEVKHELSNENVSLFKNKEDYE